MTQQANAIVLSLLAIMLVSSMLLAGAITLGKQVKAHHDDMNKPRNLTMLQSNLTKGN
jgi:Na+-transporting NADH:ubiquinone oxidoreductase subunit NqrC